MSRKKELIITACILLFCFFSLLIVAGIIISRPSFQSRLLAELSKKVGYNIRASSIKISLQHGIGIKIQKLYVQPKKKEFIFFCPKLFLNYKFSELIKGKLIPEAVILESPSLEIEKISSSGEKGFPKEKLLLVITQLPSVDIKDAAISIKPYEVRIKNTNLYVRRVSKKAIAVDLNLNVSLKNASFPVNAKGDLYADESGELVARFDTELKAFPLSCIKKEDIIVFLNGTAFAKFSLHASVSKGIKTSGNIRIEKPDFLLIGTDSQKKEYKFPYLTVQFKGNYRKKELLFQPVIIASKGLNLNINSKLNLSKSSPLISLKVTSSQMNIAMFKKIFPSCLLPAWLEKRLFPIIKKGELKEIRFSLNGTPAQLKHLDDPANRDVLSGSLLMDKLLLLPKGARFPLSDIKGKLIFKSGNLFIKEINAKLSSSQIKKADLLIKNIYFDSSRHYQLFLKGRFDLKDLMAQLHMEFTPPALLKAVKDFKEVAGIMDATVVCEYRESWKMPVFKNSSAHLSDIRIAYNKIPEPLFIKRGDFWIDTNGNFHFSGKVILGDSKLYVLADVDEKFKNIGVNISGDVFPHKLLKKYVSNNIIIKGPLKIKASINNKNDIWHLSGKILSKKRIPLKFYSLVMNPVPFSIGFSINYSSEKILVKKFLFQSKRSSLYSSAELLSKRKKLKIRIKTKKLYLEDLGIRYKDIVSSIKGFVRTNLRVRYTFSNPFETYVYGIFDAKRLFVHKKDTPLIKNCNTKLAFFGKRISISYLSAKIEKYPFHVKGFVEGWNGLKGRIYIKSDYLDLTKLRTLKQNKKQGSNEFLKKLDLYVHVEISKAICKNITFKPIIAEFLLKNGNILIKSLLANMDHGRFTMRRKQEKVDPGYNLHLVLKEMPLEHIFSCLEIKRYIDGKISAEADINTDTDQLAQFIPYMNGRLKVSITDGKIYKAQPILKILDFFSLSNIWKFNPKSVFEDGVPFELIKIKASIRKGVISSDKMKLESKALNAAAKGKLDLNKKWIDLGVAIQPLGTVDSIIGKLPVVGYIIGGKDKKISLYYFEIKGPLSNVKVEQKPIQNMVKGTLNIFKRVLLTPAHIFEDIGGGSN